MRLGECRPNCGACCKFVTVNINSIYLQEDKKRWLELHNGLTVYERDGMAFMLIETTCQHLTEDNRCGIFGQPERPQVCSEFPFDQRDIDQIDARYGENTCSYQVVETY